MTMRHLALVPLAVLAGGLAWSADTGATLVQIYQIVLTGDQGASFVGTCELETANGQIIIKLDGDVPHQQELHGESLSCALKARGGVVVDIRQNGNRSRWATKDGIININLHSLT